MNTLGKLHGLRLACVCKQVLSGVAAYKPPNASSNGSYSLLPECWDKFDPWYLHYTPQRLRSAVDNALQAGLGSCLTAAGTAKPACGAACTVLPSS